MTKYDDMLNKVPFEIRNILKALSNDYAWVILNAILENDHMTMREIFGMFINLNEVDNMNKVEEAMAVQTFYAVESTVESLISSGLIERRAPTFGDIGNKKKEYYVPTETAKTLIDALFESLLLHPVTEEEKK
jgi:predicted transcriptional regulator